MGIKISLSQKQTVGILHARHSKKPVPGTSHKTNLLDDKRSLSKPLSNVFRKLILGKSLSLYFMFCL